MNIIGKERALEENRLSEAFEKLSKRISDLETSLQTSAERLKKSNEQMWESGKRSLVDFSDAIENMSYLDNIKLDFFEVEMTKKELNRMRLLHRDMYFGRIDFQEEDYPELEKIYIGKFSFTDDEGQYLVFDWRANICSLFYENELGQVSYEAPGGMIQGEMSKKRQYEIFYEEILSMFDSSVMIDDSILKDILSKSKDSRMSNIVETIQKEQNQAIRSTYSTIIVKGPAGCGKTSIAMHRAAWLMYKYKNELRNNQILIFSPNETFNDYISEVLPELGEENINMSTFQNLAYEILGRKKVLISKYVELEDTLLKNEYINKEDLVEKYSVRFADKLKDYANYISNKRYDFKDFYIDDNIVMSKRELEKLFYEEYSSNQVTTRLSKIKNILNERIKPYIRALRKEYVEDVKNNHVDMAQGFLDLRTKTGHIYRQIDLAIGTDYENIYAGFLESAYSKEMSERFLDRFFKGFIYAEDVAPLIYLRILFGERYAFNNNIRHLIIDEIQDYSYLEKLIIKKLFYNCHMTLLGDINQKINYYVEDVKEDTLFENANIIKLNKSYRSTYQIAKFCNNLLKDNLEIEYFNRQGREPELISTEGRGCDLEFIADIIKKKAETYKKMGYKSLAVITRTDSFSKKLQPYLKDANINRITERSTSYTKGRILLPSYLAKGLEFDAVIVVDCKEDSFDKDVELNLYYTACTRALHELCVIA